MPVESALSPPQFVTSSGSGPRHDIEVSIVMPCLNEALTIATCVEKAQKALRDNNLTGEVVVADNGSTDGSQEIASSLGARVIPVEAKGYGSALRGGIAAARGKYILMGDADDSYDFSHVDRFVKKLDEGNDLVMGNRFQGGIIDNAMPLLHRYLGNPVLSFLGRLFFHVPTGDFHCGLRAFRADSIRGLNLRTTGMEFASEMVVRSALSGLRIAEVPTTLKPDGRDRAPHLRTWRDGWRHLVFLLMYSPRWLFMTPGFCLLAFGVLGYALALAGATIGHALLGVHTLLFASLFLLLGFQCLQFAVFTKIFAIREGLLPADPRLDKAMKTFSLERTLLIGLAGLVIGLALLIGAFLQWRAVDYGLLQYDHTMRWVIPGSTLTALGVQTIFSAFFANILDLRRR